MAEGLARAMGHVADSAGTHPANSIAPNAVKVLEQRGISTEGMRPKLVDDFSANDYDMATVQPLIERATNQYVEMKRFLLTDQCLMTTLLKHFGQESSAEFNCNKCSNCNEGSKFLKEGFIVTIIINTENSDILSVEMPLSVILEVVSSEPGVKGNTATNATKPAVLETGVEINVPLFINEGDKVKVDTEKGDYIERIKD